MCRRLLLFILPLLLCATAVSAAVPPSSVNLSITASAADLAAIINQSLPKELYKGQGGFGTTVSATRTGQVVVTASDNFVHLTIPVQLKFSTAMFESSPLNAGLKFKVRVSVTPDWRLKTELYYSGLSDAMVETLKVGPLSVKPKSIVDGVTQPVQKLLAPVIDAKINDSIRLKDKVGQFWQGAFTPVQVSKEFSAWLRLTPEKVVMSPLSAVNNQVRLALGIITGAEMTIGSRPAGVPPRPLPPMEQSSTFDRGFHIRLASDIFFADLVTALNPVLLDKTFGDEKKITVKRFSLKGENGRLVVALTAVGDFDGEVTVIARPVHDTQKNALVFEDVDFDTRDAGWLISAGSWLFSSTIRSTIKSKLDAAVAEQLEKSRVKATSALSAVRIAEHITLAGSVSSLSLTNTAVRDDRLSLDIIARGELQVSLK